MSEQDWIDFMSEPSQFDHDDYAYADGYYARLRVAGLARTAKPDRSTSRQRQRDACREQRK